MLVLVLPKWYPLIVSVMVTASASVSLMVRGLVLEF